jgi:hypothetical protein
MKRPEARDQESINSQLPGHAIPRNPAIRRNPNPQCSRYLDEQPFRYNGGEIRTAMLDVSDWSWATPLVDG